MIKEWRLRSWRTSLNRLVTSLLSFSLSIIWKHIDMNLSTCLFHLVCIDVEVACRIVDICVYQNPSANFHNVKDQTSCSDLICCLSLSVSHQDITSLNKQIAQLQDLVRSRTGQNGRHIQTHSNTIVVSLQVQSYIWYSSSAQIFETLQEVSHIPCCRQ